MKTSDARYTLMINQKNEQLEYTIVDNDSITMFNPIFQCNIGYYIADDLRSYLLWLKKHIGFNGLRQMTYIIEVLDEPAQSLAKEMIAETEKTLVCKMLDKKELNRIYDENNNKEPQTEEERTHIARIHYIAACRSVAIALGEPYADKQYTHHYVDTRVLIKANETVDGGYNCWVYDNKNNAVVVESLHIQDPINAKIRIFREGSWMDYVWDELYEEKVLAPLRREREEKRRIADEQARLAFEPVD